MRWTILQLRPLLSLMIALAGAGCAASGGDAPLAHRQIEAEIAFNPACGVVIEGDNGDVRIRRADGPARVRADIRGKGEQRLAGVQVVMQTDRTGALNIRVDWPIGWRQPGEAATLEVELPGCTGLTVHTGNGAIDVAGVGGEADLHSGNGEILVADHAGSARISTSNGTVQAERIAGECRVQTSNGAVLLTDVAGRVSVVTTNGSVKVELTEDNPGPLDIRTANGRVDLQIGSAFAGDLRLEAFNGRVRVIDVSGHVEVDDEHEWGVIHRGGGDARSLVRTTNGRIEVRQR